MPMRNLLLTMFLLLSSHSAYAQLDDEFRQKKIDNINKRMDLRIYLVKEDL